MTEANRVVRIGVIGCGEIAQVAHIPTLGFLSDFFRITYLCDASEDALQHCKHKVTGGIPSITRDAAELCRSENVDVVFVINSDAYHPDHTILALQNHKHVFLEKPAALNLRDIQRIRHAETISRGKVMVGYMRRFAAAFQKAKEIIGGMDKILYAHVRDIIGPNEAFVAQSGTFPKKFADFSQRDSDEIGTKTSEIISMGLSECGVEDSASNQLLWRALGGLGSHDLSAMREALGMPSGVCGASVAGMFWNATFQYQGFNVVYESGIDNVPRFDAHIEVFSKDKTVKIQYDTPYVKGLPINVHIAENDDGIYKETVLRMTYEDAYTQEMKELYSWFTNDQPVKTTIDDSEDDLKIFGMIMKAVQQT